MPEQPKPQPTPTKPQPQPAAKPHKFTTEDERVAEEALEKVTESLNEGTKNSICIDANSFSIIVIGLLQIRDSELMRVVLRRRQDYDIVDK